LIEKLVLLLYSSKSEVKNFIMILFLDAVKDFPVSEGIKYMKVDPRTGHVSLEIKKRPLNVPKRGQDLLKKSPPNQRSPQTSSSSISIFQQKQNEGVYILRAGNGAEGGI
jgi:hypothetical protein